jgi:aspartyl aminopeptidase
MHSCYETAACKDAESLVQAMKTFYGASLEAGADGTFALN